MAGRLENKVALVTGAAQGQGEAEARLFASQGARVLVTDRLEAQGRAVAKEIGDRAHFAPLDVTREDQWGRAVEEALERFGRLDVLINNAGLTVSAPLVEHSLKQFRLVVDVNQTATFLGMRAVVPAMRAAGGGSIVNIGSLAALDGHSEMIAYAGAKAAVVAMTKVAARELAPLRIRVNLIHPGLILTPMARRAYRDPELLGRVIPLGRAGDPTDIASVAVFLASNESAYVTGAEIKVDGGIHTCAVDQVFPKIPAG